MSSTLIAPAAPAEDERRKRAAWRPLAAAAAAGSVLVITGFGVWASLNATATGVTSVNSGTLKLVMADSGVGFTQNLTNMAPGDSINRFVSLTNTGTLDGKALTLAITAPAGNVLVTDGVSPSTTKAAKLTVQNCAGATWNATTGACGSGGVVTTLLGPAALSTLATPNTLANVSTLAATNGGLNLKLTVALPDQAETTVNGILPTGGIQNATAALTYTFAETQRDVTVTTS